VVTIEGKWCPVAIEKRESGNHRGEMVPGSNRKEGKW
jgi:hypothetical protein